MAQEENHNKSGFALGALLGAAAGAIAGLLFAPKSGKETRTEIKNKAEALEADARAKAGDAKRKAEGAAAEVKATRQRWGDKAKGVARAGRDALAADTELGSKAKQTEAKLRARELKEDIKRSVKR